MAKKTNLSLVGYAIERLGTGYVYGTFGQVLTNALLEAKIRQYPEKIKDREAFIRQNWMGKPVQDCVGLIKGHLWTNDNGRISYRFDGIPDLSADGMFNNAKEKGPITTLPETQGLLVWKKGHIGVYIGNGEVVESHGTFYGVIKTRLNKSINETGWTNWIKCPFIDYVTPIPSESPYTLYTVKKGDSLWAIANRLLGDGNRHKEIAQANGLSDPYIIQPNQILKVPRK